MTGSLYFQLSKKRLGFRVVLTETERLLLVGKKDEIRKLTEEILDLSTCPKDSETEIKKKITGILSLISVIASYSKPKNCDLNEIRLMANLLDSVPMQFLLEIFCNTVNSIRFDFTRRDLKIVIPPIDLTIFRSK